MGIMVLTFGSPETAENIRDLALELVYAMGRTLDLEQVALGKPDTLVLGLHAVAPFRGVIPNGTQFKRKHGEFWSSYGIDFEGYVTGDARAKLNALRAAMLGAINQVPDDRMSPAQKAEFATAASAGVELLLSEPERVHRFNRPIAMP